MAEPTSDQDPEDRPWICLDWYDGPLSEISIYETGREPLVEIRTVGGWVGEGYRVGADGEKHYDNHMRFDRRTLQAMLDLIDGKPVKEWHEE